MRPSRATEDFQNCPRCTLRRDWFLCNLSEPTIQALDRIKLSLAFPSGSTIFMEGEAPRGVFIVCKGRVRLSISSRSGKKITLKIVGEGEALGLSACISGKPFGATAETLGTCQLGFVKRNDFLILLHEYHDASIRVAERLSQEYNAACEDIRLLVLSHSASEKLANLFLTWKRESGKSERPIRIRLPYSHDDIAEMIGTSRETVTRLMAEFKKKRIIQLRGRSLVILDLAALLAIAHSRGSPPSHASDVIQ